MARAKKPRYEYIESKQLYRKRLKGRDGKTVALYGKTPQELSIKIEEFQEDLLNYQDNRENPYVGDYADYWLDLQEGHLTYGAYTDYQSVINRHIKPPMEGLRILRHTYITNLLFKGVDIKTVQYLAGHERAKITLDIYAHLTYSRP